MKRTFYDILHIPVYASVSNIKSARNRLIQQYHPDKAISNKDQADYLFHEINEAYSVLSNPKKTIIYNALLSNRPKEQFSASVLKHVQESGLFSATEILHIKTGLNAREIMEHRKSAKLVLDAQDLDVHIQQPFTLEEAYYGPKKEIAVTRQRHCVPCDGSGAKDSQSFHECAHCLSLGFEIGEQNPGTQCSKCSGTGIIIRRPCLACKGQGHHQEKVTISFTVPKGAVEGSVVKIASEGDQMAQRSGHLYIHMVALTHDVFHRDTQDLRLTVQVDPGVLSKGGLIAVPSLKGPLSVNLIRGIGPQAVTVRGAGMPYHLQPGRISLGVMYVQFLADYSGKKVTQQKKEFARFFKRLEDRTGKTSDTITARLIRKIQLPFGRFKKKA